MTANGPGMAGFAPNGPGSEPGAMELDPPGERRRSWLHWFRSRDDHNPSSSTRPQAPPQLPAPGVDSFDSADMSRLGFGKRIRKVVPGLPRPATFKRQISEQRDRLQPTAEKGFAEARRTLSVDRRPSWRRRRPSPTPVNPSKLSAPAMYCAEEPSRESSKESLAEPVPLPPPLQPQPAPQAHTEPTPLSTSDGLPDAAPNGPHSPTLPADAPPQVARCPAPLPSPPPDDDLLAGMDSRWILNLSMHFRDKSPREKFFITYAETPTRWRRVTVSCDYSDARQDSLEHDLQHLPYQREKSERIYEALAASLPSIQFYDTVTNLRLETSSDDRLHVHVTEDANEVIRFPQVSSVAHLRHSQKKPVRLFAERDVEFDEHMSGFVYRVRLAGETGDSTEDHSRDRSIGRATVIKKEIPGPDSVEEFLYEVNALYNLREAPNVIRLVGLVTDDKMSYVTGLLLKYAEKGPLVDLLYDRRDDPDAEVELPWPRRIKWARQIVKGLAAVHDAGFVQGDFTLANIVIDADDDAQIIDINRRGCPVGWEPDEFRGPLASGQRVTLYIGVKSDLFQLGMVLWALAKIEDEPERQRPLSFEDVPDVPAFYREIAERCLSSSPAERGSAKELLELFPADLAPSTTPGPATTDMTGSAPLHTPGSTTHELAFMHGGGLPPPHVPAAVSPFPSPSPSPARGRSRGRSAGDGPAATAFNPPFDDPDTSYYVGRDPSRGRRPGPNTAHLDNSSLPTLSIHRRSRPGTAGGSEPADADVAMGKPQIVTGEPGADRWSQLEYHGQSILISRSLVEEEAAGRERELERRHEEQEARHEREEMPDRALEPRQDGAERQERSVEIEESPVEDQHRLKRREGNERLSLEGLPGRAMSHIDSGIADMELPGSAREDGARREGQGKLERMVEERLGPVREVSAGDPGRRQDQGTSQQQP